MNGLIVAAIEQRWRRPTLSYSAGNRIVEPHVYGLDGGREMLRCYQIGGESVSAERYGWTRLRSVGTGTFSLRRSDR